MLSLFWFAFFHFHQILLTHQHGLSTHKTAKKRFAEKQQNLHSESRFVFGGVQC